MEESFLILREGEDHEHRHRIAAVIDELDWEPSIDAAQIGVTAHAGIVTLTGTQRATVRKWRPNASQSDSKGSRRSPTTSRYGCPGQPTHRLGHRADGRRCPEMEDGSAA